MNLLSRCKKVFEDSGYDLHEVIFNVPYPTTFLKIEKSYDIYKDGCYLYHLERNMEEDGECIIYVHDVLEMDWERVYNESEIELVLDSSLFLLKLKHKNEGK